ncbi:MAG: zinc ribbon domain-containing protein [Cryobacterium sp.]|nr:zinc ribbon domain-containing protein [Cryobacterium sp.]MBX3310239.1 zinc ribbon domain-containing protein [Cryobacterium sp.]
MDSCESCGRELASRWKFCIYCGRPTLHSAERSAAILSSSVASRSSNRLDPLAAAGLPSPAKSGASSLPVPAPSTALPPDPAESMTSKYGAGFWVGVAMGALGLVLIIYAAVQIYASNA